MKRIYRVSYAARRSQMGSGQARLVRQALEQELMTLRRSAEIMRLDIRSMRARASSWVGEP